MGSKIELWGWGKKKKCKPPLSGCHVSAGQWAEVAQGLCVSEVYLEAPSPLTIQLQPTTLLPLAV